MMARSIERSFGGLERMDFVRVFFVILRVLKDERHDGASNYSVLFKRSGKSGSPTQCYWDKEQFLCTVMTVNKFIRFGITS